MGDAEPLAAGQQEIVLNLIGRCEGYGMDEDIELAVGLLESGKEGVDLGVDGEVALERPGIGERGGQLVGVTLETLALIADGECGPGVRELLGDSPGDTALVGESEDDGDFALEIDHDFRCFSSEISLLRIAASPRVGECTLQVRSMTSLEILSEYYVSHRSSIGVMLVKKKTDSSEILKGTLDMMILRTLIHGDAHGHTIAKVIERSSEDVLEIEQGSLYPALHRMEDRGWISSYWGASENNRKARFYQLTAGGRKQLTAESRRWQKMTRAIALVMGESPAQESGE